jgi:hypothetical protein
MASSAYRFGQFADNRSRSAAVQTVSGGSQIIEAKADNGAAIDRIFIVDIDICGDTGAHQTAGRNSGVRVPDNLLSNLFIRKKYTADRNSAFEPKAFNDAML